MSFGPRRWLQPELWLVLGIPLASLVGGAITLRLVQGDLSAAGESEGARHTAQVQTAELGPDVAAANRRLDADLHIDRAAGMLRVSLRGDAGAGSGLRLELEHPLHASLDRSLRLQRRGSEWSAPLASLADARWRVVLSDPARTWRVVGRLHAGSMGTHLQPALGAP